MGEVIHMETPVNNDPDLQPIVTTVSMNTQLIAAGVFVGLWMLRTNRKLRIMNHAMRDMNEGLQLMNRGLWSLDSEAMTVREIVNLVAQIPTPKAADIAREIAKNAA